MNKSRIHKLLQYALAEASQNENWDQRELGPIHLIKYVYLADLAYAEVHGGETYTGIPWRFHKFGPRCEDVFLEIDTALAAIGAEKKQISGQYQDDYFRWRNTDLELADRLQSDLDFLPALSIKDAVRTFGSDTAGLLDYVYRTEPMLRAAPGEELDFSSFQKLHRDPEEDELDISRPFSQGQQKRRNKKIAELKEELKKRFQKKQERIKHQERDSTQPPSRYDEVYHEGVAWLDSLACEEIPESSFTASIHPDLWKSRARHDPDLSE